MYKSDEFLLHIQLIVEFCNSVCIFFGSRSLRFSAAEYTGGNGTTSVLLTLYFDVHGTEFVFSRLD